MEDNQVSERLVEWTRHSGSGGVTATKSGGGCRADYFSINDKPKIRIDLFETSEANQREVKFRDNHVIISSEKFVRDWLQSTLSPFQYLTMTLVLIISLSFWYMKRKWTFEKLHPSRFVAKESSQTTDIDSETFRCIPPTSSSVPQLVSERVASTASEKEDTLQTSLQNVSYFVPEQQAIAYSQTEAEAKAVHSLQGNLNFDIAVTTETSTTMNISVFQQRAKEMTVALEVAQTCFKEAGVQVEAKDLIPWIAQQQIASVQRIEKIEREARRYVFEASQNQLNRQEAAAVHREDCHWMERIKIATNDLVSQVERSSCQVLFVETCVQVACWLQDVLQTTASFPAIGRAIWYSVSLRPR